ncbi:Gfo/Idh/MocA family protein [Vallicoccus soli]|uniref:Gfo/Idh/MocA family protein n=1 Tax=Vallicoccus soli TaxID=2339232 RepID=UPI001401D090|nr:Gfo/Idh/MocA family oxidoreductase [Vallicoccus soli]
MGGWGGAVRWGFLGAGRIARELAPVVHASRGACLQAVASRDVERARRLRPRGRAYGSYAALVADDDVDAVYVALHHDAHAEWVVEALRHGKHVLCEKPLGLDAGEVRRMADAAREAGRLLVEASWYRWHPRTLRAEALLATGAVGEVRRVWTGFTGRVEEGGFRHDPAHGGGALLDVGCYAASAALWATGWQMLEAVKSVELERGPTGVDLRGTALLQLGLATAEVRFAMADDVQQWLAVEGDDGRLDVVGSPYSSRAEPSVLLVGGHAEHFAPVDPYQLMVEGVSGAVRGDVDEVLPLEQSLRTAELLDAVRGSAS